MNRISGDHTTLRDRAVQVLLWYSVFAWATWWGGTLYQMLVVVPMWSASPPESVVAFFLGTEYNTTIFHFFGPPFMAARTIPIAITLAMAWHLPRHRIALAVAVVGLLFAVMFTLFYIYPINAVLFQQAGGDQSPAEIADMVRRWVWADRLRFGVGTIVFGCILRAFRLPPSQR